MIHPLGSLLKIRVRPLFIVRHKLLWIARDEREPGALNLHHDPVAAAKGMIDVWQFKIERRWLVGSERLGFFEAVTEFSAEGLAAHELLVATHFNLRGIGVGIVEVRGVDIDEFYDEVGVRSGSRDP